jgi:hypothetical protein
VDPAIWWRGGAVLARTTDDPRLRKDVRDAARAQALALLEAGIA